jgi:hypothetical protein
MQENCRCPDICPEFVSGLELHQRVGYCMSNMGALLASMMLILKN